MKRTSILVLSVAFSLALLAAGCGRRGSTLTDKERSIIWQRIKAIEPIAAVHKGKDKLAVSTDAVLNEFKRATGHQVATVERSGLQQLLDQKALQELDIFDGSSDAARKKLLTKAKGLLYHTVSAENEYRFTAKLEQKWVITGSVRIVNAATGETIYNSRTVKAGGKRTIPESIAEYAYEMGRVLGDDLGR